MEQKSETGLRLGWGLRRGVEEVMAQRIELKPGIGIGIRLGWTRVLTMQKRWLKWSNPRFQRHWERRTYGTTDVL